MINRVATDLESQGIGKARECEGKVK